MSLDYSHRTLSPCLTALLHLLPHLHVLLYRVVPVLRLCLGVSLNLHRLRIRVVDIGFALLEQLLAVTKDSLEVIRCAAEVIILNLQKIHVLQ